MIRVLEDRLINKIAAGEVVERPASVVKELLENAIDAGGKTIRVELKGGGRSLIRVSDDGKGMDRQDATLSIERHATSKIRTDDDLFNVRTLGFRGEALPSIAAVGRFEMRTRVEDEDKGTRIAVEGGRLVDISDVGCPVGTDIAIRTLFFNTPARRKFLRTAGTELSHCLEAVTRQVLNRPDIDIEVVHDGRTVLRAAVAADASRRAADLLGAHGEALVPIAFEEGNLTLEALVSPVGVHRASSRGATYMYVNDRFVNDMVLRRAIREAYRGLVPKGRHPTVVLSIQIPHDHVDVNVHPAKTEVRFRFANDLTQAIGLGLRGGLEGHGIKKPVADEARYQPQLTQGPTDQSRLPLRPARQPFPEPFEPITRPMTGGTGSLAPTPVKPPEAPRALVMPQHRDDAKAVADDRDLLPVPTFRDLQVLGQLARTYILCEGAGELVVVDQHAAHERIMLHEIMAAPRRHLGSGKRFLSPPVIDLAPARAAALAAHTDMLSPYGFEIEPFGDNSFAVKQVPSALGGADLIRLIEDVADDIAEGGTGKPAADLVEHALATMACHSAIRAGQSLSTYEMREVLSALDTVDFSVCAHGRPVSIRISPAELERRFHRT